MLRPGEQFHHYRLQQQLGRGAMATVYRAIDENDGTVLALKVLTLTDDWPEEHLDEARLRMLREAEAAGRLEHPDIVAVKAFMLGLMRFDLQPLPADPVLLVHLALVALLMLVFPISKLLHAPGLFFSPTRNQADTSREARHVSAWAAALEKK